MIGAFFDGLPMGNVIGGPLDGSSIVGPSALEPTEPVLYKIIYNHAHEYVFDYVTETWIYEGELKSEPGFKTIRLVATLDDSGNSG